MRICKGETGHSLKTDFAGYEPEGREFSAWASGAGVCSRQLCAASAPLERCAEFGCKILLAWEAI